jgi:putative ABC transport system permease protein
MRIPLRRGRLLSEHDNSTNAPRAVIFNESLVRKVFPEEDPLSKRIEFWGSRWEVVGVVGDVRHNGLEGKASSRIYLPQAFCPWTGSLIVRTTMAPFALADSVRQAILSLDADQPVSNLRTLEQMVSNSVGQRRLTLLLLGIFASVALLLAAIGLYGVMAYSVTQRTHEIGIRMALGARRRDVLGLVVKQGMLLTLLGVALGLIGSFALTRLIASQLFQVTATDPTAFGGVAAILGIVAFVACLIPARRATKVDPMEALRYE